MSSTLFLFFYVVRLLTFLLLYLDVSVFLKPLDANECWTKNYPTLPLEYCNSPQPLSILVCPYDRWQLETHLPQLLVFGSRLISDSLIQSLTVNLFYSQYDTAGLHTRTSFN